MELALIIIPLLFAAATFVVKNVKMLRAMLPLAAIAHFALAVHMLLNSSEQVKTCSMQWICLDAPGMFFLLATSLLFLAASFFTLGFLKEEEKEKGPKSSEAHFIALMLVFLSSMSFVCLAQHFGVLWVAIEMTTLASAPLIFFHRSKRSLEATWKYLILCSVGIALALIGNFLFSIAGNSIGDLPLFMSSVVSHAGEMSPDWLKMGFVFITIGYGTKMGLAPVHNWLPDAHSEAPSVISSLLSGALLNCAFLGIWRGYTVVNASGAQQFGSNVLIFFGIFSIVIAAIFILKQQDFKRMLAYSSVEHMGLIALGVGLGGAATKMAFLHSFNHSFTKAALFMVAGNIVARFKTKSISGVSGLLKQMPISGFLWFVGILAIAGMPPFGIFVSKFSIFRQAFSSGNHYLGIVMLLFIGLVFIGLTTAAAKMAFGAVKETVSTKKESFLSVAPPALMLAVTLVLGVYLPPWLMTFIDKVTN